MATPTQYKETTLSVGIELFVAHLGRAVALGSLASSTANNYRNDLKLLVALVEADRILDSFEGVEIDEILHNALALPDGRFKDQKVAKGVGSSIRFRSTLSRFFAFALDNALVRESPMKTSEIKPKQRGDLRTARTALKSEAVTELLDAAVSVLSQRSDMQLARRDEFIIRLLIESGIRVGEITNANTSDLYFDSDGYWLRVLGKGAKVRTVPLSAATYICYEKMLQDRSPTDSQRSSALILTYRGKPMSSRDVENMLNRVSSRMDPALRRQITPHALRHTAATLLLSAGTGVHVVKDLLGHANISTTSQYLDTNSTALRDAINSHPLNEALNKS